MSQPEYVTRDALAAFAETIAKDVTGAIIIHGVLVLKLPFDVVQLLCSEL